jgi:hypothetical protein
MTKKTAGKTKTTKKKNGPAASSARTRRELAVGAGYKVVARREQRRDLLMVQAPDGRVCLKVLLLPEGPVVEVEGQALRLAAAGEIRLDCEELAINVRKDVALRAGGVIESDARAQRLRARLGDIQLAANDDVSLDGERIRLNSPRAEPPAVSSAAPSATSSRPATLRELLGHDSD